MRDTPPPLYRVILPPLSLTPDLSICLNVFLFSPARICLSVLSVSRLTACLAVIIHGSSVCYNYNSITDMPVFIHLYSIYLGCVNLPVSGLICMPV
jgi:hypothetical protein